VFTIPARFGEVFVSGLREDVDCLVVDYPIDKSRAIVKAKTGLVYLNTCTLDPSTKEVSYASNSPTENKFERKSLGSPRFKSAKPGSPFFGTAMVFSTNRSVQLHDADNETKDGYLITACVGFTDTTLLDGETRNVFAKSDRGGFTLELHNPAGAEPTILRYGVRVADQYVYATYPASTLNNTDSYFIVAAYDGDGSVRMWIDGNDEGVITSATIGGVVQNDSPVVIGADPQGPNGQRNFFRGVIQQVQLQNWTGH
jgi:hypothetical protein